MCDRAGQPLQHGAQRVLALRQHRHRVADHVVGDDLAVAVVDDAARRRQRQLAQAVRLRLQRVLLRAGAPACGRTRRRGTTSTPATMQRRGAAAAARCRSDESSLRDLGIPAGVGAGRWGDGTSHAAIASIALDARRR